MVKYEKKIVIISIRRYNKYLMNSDCTNNQEGYALTETERQGIIEALTMQIKKARAASPYMALLSESQKNLSLELLERELRESVSFIIEANKKDLEDPDNASLSSSLKDRLLLNSERIMAMAASIRKIINIKDPIGTVIDGWQHPNGMRITKVRVPLGVIGIIYEARPNVTVDAIALAIKSGNSVVLRGSKQAWHTNQAIMEVVYRSLEQTSIPLDGIQYLNDKLRESCKLLLRSDIDLVIPRGGEALNKFVLENSLVPVMGAGGGNCHVYIDQFADPEKAIDICINAKTSRTSVCNATEKILIHNSIKEEILPALVEELLKRNVEIIADQTVKVMFPFIQNATDADWPYEYLDLKVAIKIVDDIQEAIDHINFYSTKHSEAIITEDISNADLFKRMIDSACVYINASTRFTDGEEFGFGAEMGISTQKMHARGPIGAYELCSYKYIIDGDGQIR